MEAATSQQQQNPQPLGITSHGSFIQFLKSFLEGEALEEAVRAQLEYLLSRDHLASDYFLVSQMNAEMYVPMATLASLCTFSTDVAFVTSCMKKSTTTTLDPTGTLIKPNFKISRTTLILRDISSSVEPEVDILISLCLRL